MRNIFLILLFFSGLVFSQSTIKFKGKILELLSSEKRDLKGILSDPKFSKHSQKLFSFVRQLEDNRYLYLYNTETKDLSTIQTVIEADEMEISFEKYKPQSLTFNDQLDWCPVADNNGRHWFAFVSNGADDNHDIYIGYVDGKNYLRLTRHESIDNYPKWSPDGESIAFISARNGKGDIYIIKNLKKVMDKQNAGDAILVQLTKSREEETELAWNPNQESFLLAYSQRVYFATEKVESYQIRIIDVEGESKIPYKITTNPKKHFSRPIWDSGNDSRLLYTGQGLGKDTPADLYITKLKWNENGKLKHTKLRGHNEELFKNVNLSGAHALWLTGGKAILLQEKNKVQNNPIYIVNIDRWQKRRTGTTSYFEDLHSKFPVISGYDLDKNMLLVTIQDGKYFKVMATLLSGNDILPYAEMKTVMNRPGPSIPWYYYAGGGIGTTIGILLFLPSENGNGPINGPVKIGRPPSMPDEN